MDGVFIPADIPEDIKDAIACVTKVFEDSLASGKHQPGDWRRLGWEGNYDHLTDHCNAIESGGSSEHEVMMYPERFDDDHLRGIACRALLLLQLREEARRNAK